MKSIVCIILILSVTLNLALSQTVGASMNLDAAGVAIDKYDPVSYFTDHKPLQGKEEYRATYGGATYYFSSARNLETFRGNPGKYIPQYGGWCAYAMGASGEKVEIDPETFKILDGKLYLFYNRFFNNTLNSWNKDEANLKVKADKNWAKLTKQ